MVALPPTRVRAWLRGVGARTHRLQLALRSRPTRARPPFSQTIGTLVFVLGLVLGFLVFHPAISPLADTLGFNACIALMAVSFIGGVVTFLGLSVYGRRHNQTVDALIEQRCRRAQEQSGAEFSYVALHTSTCKPKHVRTYRAVALLPAGGSTIGSSQAQAVAMLRAGYGARTPVAVGTCSCVPVATAFAQPNSITVAPHAAFQPVAAPTIMAVAVPKGIRPGDTITVRAPDGQTMAVVVPGGVAEGSTFNVHLPQPQHAAAVIVDAIPIP